MHLLNPCGLHNERKTPGGTDTDAPARQRRGADPRSFLIEVKDWEIIAKQDVQIVQLKPEKGSEINVLIKDVQYDRN